MNEIFDQKNFAIIGNFPYNISSQIIFKIEKNKEYVPLIYGMFQREVAERIVVVSTGDRLAGRAANKIVLPCEDARREAGAGTRWADDNDVFRHEGSHQESGD